MRGKHKVEGYGIDEDGDIVGIAGFGGGYIHAIKWVVVPEPGAGLLVSFGLIGLAGRRRARA